MKKTTLTDFKIYLLKKVVLYSPKELIHLTLTIVDYLDQTRYISKHLIELLNMIESDRINIEHNMAMIPHYEKNSRTFSVFAKQVRAEGAEEEAMDFILKGIEHSNIAQSYNEQVSEVQEQYNNALLIINNPLQSVAQALLQIGKQGISSQYGKLKKDCVNEFVKVNKEIPLKCNVNILDIIWEGRNQSIHYEDKTFNRPVEECFEKLLQNNHLCCDKLAGYKNGENKAYEIIKILSWDSHEVFEKDLISLSL